MSKRPNIVDAHERVVEGEIQASRSERDAAMAERMAAIEVTERPEPYIRSVSRGPAGHEVPDEVRAWIEAEDEAQLGHYRRIYQEQERLAPWRDVWIAEFFERITGPRGFSVHAGTRKTIPTDQIPARPDRPWRVVW